MASFDTPGRRRTLLLTAATLLAACAHETPPASSGPGRGAYPQQYPPQQYPPQQYPPQQYPPQQYPPQQSPPQQSPPPPQTPAPAAADPAQACVDSINRHRATLGLPALARWKDNEACTAHEAQLDAQRGVPHGSFGTCHESAQNVCPGWDGPPGTMTEPCVQSMWDEGPGADFSAHGHYLNMTNKQYRAVACGYFVQPSGAVWLIQNFSM